MPGFRYEVLLSDDEPGERAAYWSAYRLARGSKLFVGGRLLVVLETRPAPTPPFDFVADCRLAREDEQLS